MICSRGNPEALQATCLGLANTARYPERLRFRIRADDDDRFTVGACARLSRRMNLEAIIGPRPESLGAEVNRLVASVEADHYAIMGDDVQPYTLHWDLALDRTEQDLTCWALQHPEQPPDYPIVSKYWIKACGGRVFTDRFPFWFDDRWLAEVGILVYGRLPPALPIGLHAHKTRTQRMRDLPLWLEYYGVLEPERVAQAQEIADWLFALGRLGKQGFIKDKRLEQLEDMRRFHAAYTAEALRILAPLHDLAPPDPAYLRAKVRAEAHLHRMKAA